MPLNGAVWHFFLPDMMQLARQCIGVICFVGVTCGAVVPYSLPYRCAFHALGWWWGPTPPGATRLFCDLWSALFLGSWG